ncbi:Clp1/GlmU family protein [Marinobacter zhejiangensis]|uniref:Ribonuclease BN, tRNA processing enzyme n=1 Tax=Marinobacter zhejiangensis TaxID=488535 RepID=A0A1I4Q9P6_9GAMM|nr:Clp1/GlmU family protein [Marinobacter zhejiangensis]SFM36777.1 Ribonuclease BN, tRNA processing enzyme [Marinobacter zhejiangensis]
MTTASGRSPAQLVDDLFAQDRRAILLGQSGSGKTTLATALMAELQARGRTAVCLNCDPGLPAFGPPGALSVARFDAQGWTVLATAPLCSLDAGRFRLPLLMATRYLLQTLDTLLPSCEFTLLVDTPGLYQGVAAMELLPALVDSIGIDLGLVLTPDSNTPRLPTGLPPLQIPLEQIPRAPEAHPLTKAERWQSRNRLWQSHMANAHDYQVPRDQFVLAGTPPALTEPETWQGRQIALFHDEQPQTMGEVVSASPQQFHLRVASVPACANRLLVRDAVNRNGHLRTVPKPTGNELPEFPDDARAIEVRAELGALTSITQEPQVAVRVGSVVASLVNGVMGDPLLQVRMLHHPRSLLFDVGDTGRMPLRAAHQVSDLFLSHGHADHIGGFIWLVRSRIGHFPPCRIFGPPGVLGLIKGMVNGILWDRVEDRGPCFEVHEWHGARLKRWRVTAGNPSTEPLPDQPVDDGIIVREPGFVVRAAELDHGTPVLAYAYEPQSQLRVRKDKLDELGLAPGPWLQKLKQAYFRSHWSERIELGDGRTPTVDELTRALLLVEPGEKLAYATDFGDSEENVRRLSELARNAHTLFCEASFLCADQPQAQRTHHLTTEACARIANRAQVQQLVAFHFSHRYEKRREEVYQELQQYTPRVLIPKAMAGNGLP